MKKIQIFLIFLFLIISVSSSDNKNENKEQNSKEISNEKENKPNLKFDDKENNNIEKNEKPEKEKDNKKEIDKNEEKAKDDNNKNEKDKENKKEEKFEDKVKENKKEEKIKDKDNENNEKLNNKKKEQDNEEKKGEIKNKEKEHKDKNGESKDVDKDEKEKEKNKDDKKVKSEKDEKGEKEKDKKGKSKEKIEEDNEEKNKEKDENKDKDKKKKSKDEKKEKKEKEKKEKKKEKSKDEEKKGKSKENEKGEIKKEENEDKKENKNKKDNEKPEKNNKKNDKKDEKNDNDKSHNKHEEKKKSNEDEGEKEKSHHKKEEKSNEKNKEKKPNLKKEKNKKDEKSHEKDNEDKKEEKEKDKKEEKEKDKKDEKQKDEKDKKEDKSNNKEEKDKNKSKKKEKKDEKSKDKKEKDKSKEKNKKDEKSKSKESESIINISDYEYPHPDDENYDYIAILSTNDIHGAFYPQTINGTISYSYGGVEYLAKYITIMRNEWKDKFIWLDGGDIFQGGIESSLSHGDIMTDFMNTMQCNASTVGNHEWDYGQDFLIRQMGRSHFPYIVDNMLNTTCNKTLFLPNQVITKIFEFGKIKIGVIGITTITTPQTTFGDLHGIEFLDYSDIIIREAKELRKKTNSVILLSHAGMKCLKDGDRKLKLQIWTEKSKQNECNPEDEIYILLNALPEHTVDAVVAAHKHDVTHHWINHTPVYSSLNNAVYSQIMYLPFDKKTGQLVREEIKIESPLPVCEKIFESTRRCTPMNPKEASKLGKLSKFSFHGTVIEKEPLLKNVSDTYWPKYNNFLTSIITKSNDVLQMNKNSENSLGNLYCDIMRRSTGADVSILNSGAFRNTWNPGQISLANIFGMSPFETRIVTVEMTGAELLKMLEQTEGGKYGFYPTSGLRLLVTLEPKKKLYYAKLFDGLYEYPIDDNKTYVVATTDFDIPYGGDDFADVMKWYKPRNLKYYDVVRNVIIDYLKRVATIKDKQFVRTSLPRMRIVNKVDLDVPPGDIGSIDDIKEKKSKKDKKVKNKNKK